MHVDETLRGTAKGTRNLLESKENVITLICGFLLDMYFAIDHGHDPVTKLHR